MDRAALLAELLSRWGRLRASGQDASLEHICRDHPELLGELRHNVEAIARVEAFTVAGSSGGADPTSTAQDRPPDVAGYELLRPLGRGTYGLVYLARDRQLDRLVALKVLLDPELLGPDARGRLLREARALARLRHPHILRIHDVGEHSGWPFLVLEYIDGGSLADRAGKPWPVPRAVELVVKLARAVHAAHEEGIVHRDLKPGNVLLAGDGSPRLADFGLARDLLGPGGQTCSGAVLGTACYMSPEQARGRSHQVGPAADIHALGVILYELLTGRPPFQGESPLDVLLQVSGETASPPSRHRRLPSQLDAICLRCLAKEPQDRYPSAAALADELERFLANPGRPRRAVRRLVPFLLAGLLLGSLLAAWRWRPAPEPEGDASLVKPGPPPKRLEAPEAAPVPVQRPPDPPKPEVADRVPEKDIARGFVLFDGGKKAAWLQEERGVALKDLATAAVRLQAVPGKGRLSSLASPDGTSLVALDESGQVCGLPGGTSTLPYKGGPARVAALAYSPDGRLVAFGREGGGISLHEAATGRPVFQRDNERVSWLAVSPDGQSLAWGNFVWAVTLWDTASDRSLLPEAVASPPGKAAVFAPSGRWLALLAGDRNVEWRDAVTGEVLGVWKSAGGRLVGIGFDAQERRLLAGTAGGEVLSWALKEPPRRPQAPPSEAELGRLWDQLGEEPGKARAAVKRLLEHPQEGLALVQKRLQPQLDVVARALIAQDIADLDSDDAAVRRGAHDLLRKAGRTAEPALRRELTRGPSGEVFGRIESLLKELKARQPIEERQASRAVWLLELVATAEAAAVLRELGGKDSAAWVRERAGQALQRLGARRR